MLLSIITQSSNFEANRESFMNRTPKIMSAVWISKQCISEDLLCVQQLENLPDLLRYTTALHISEVNIKSTQHRQEWRAAPGKWTRAGRKH